jgi:ribonuclease BN (tRNA processing enzyme)
MKLVLLGTGGYHPNERRHTACLMLPQEGIVLDAGTGFFRVGSHLATPTLDVLLSHAHLDHVVGLTYLLDTLADHPHLRVTVHAPAEKIAAVRTHLLHEDLFPATLPCQWSPLGETPITVGGATVRHFPLAHPGGSTGFRLDWPDRSLAYVTDTTACPSASYIQHIRGVDLLVHECNFSDVQQPWAERTGHSFSTAVAQVAAAAGVGRLLLVHLDARSQSPDPVGLEHMRKLFPSIDLGEDGLVIEF